MPEMPVQSSRSAPKRPTVTPSQITATARSMLQESPGSKLSMRKIAERLDVSAPALYWHFSSRAELLEALTIELLGEIEWPPRTGDWRHDARELAHATRHAFLRSAELRLAMTEWEVSGVVAGMSAVQSRAIMEDAGFGPTEAAFASRQLMWHVFGYLRLEGSLTWQRDPRGGETSRYIVEPRTSGNRDNPLGVDEHSEHLDVDALFTRSLDALLAGIAADLDRQSGTP